MCVCGLRALNVHVDIDAFRSASERAALLLHRGRPSVQVHSSRAVSDDAQRFHQKQRAFSTDDSHSAAIAFGTRQQQQQQGWRT